MKIPAFLHRFASPKHFYEMAGRLTPWLGGLALAALACGLWLGLFVAPPDYQQGESVRILYVHVPAAWMSLFVYMTIAVCSLLTLVWRIKLADVVAAVSAPLGASFTALALVTGSLWGKPMWGSWWIWDARLTSELILLFLYFGYMALRTAIEEERVAARAAALLALVGTVNIPIIHYSVDWWRTLHQGATVLRFDKPTIALEMLIPLLLMAVGFQLYYFTVALIGARAELLRRESHSAWTREIGHA